MGDGHTRQMKTHAPASDKNVAIYKQGVQKGGGRGSVGGKVGCEMKQKKEVGYVNYTSIKLGQKKKKKEPIST